MTKEMEKLLQYCNDKVEQLYRARRDTTSFAHKAEIAKAEQAYEDIANRIKTALRG